MGKGYLIDSNVIIDFFKSLPESGRNLLAHSSPVISVITFVEIFSSKNITDIERNDLHNFAEATAIYEVNNNVALKTIDLRLKYKIKLPDALIAATAIYYDLILVTRNVTDFDKIKGLNIINPHAI